MKSALSLVLISIMALSAMGKVSWTEKPSDQILAHIRSLEIESFEDLVAKNEAGDWVAQFAVGYFYGEGSGVRQDSTKALHWLKRSAEGGEAWVQGYVGALYLTGQWVEVDFREAMKWLGLAAEQGFAPAQATISGMYVLGQGVPREYVQAYKWLNLALASGYDAAAEGLDVLPAQITPSQIEEAQRLSREWFERRQN